MRRREGPAAKRWEGEGTASPLVLSRSKGHILDPPPTEQRHYFHLYGLSREDADYILSTFPIVRRHDEAEHDRFLTRDLILHCFAPSRLRVESKMSEGQPYFAPRGSSAAFA